MAPTKVYPGTLAELRILASNLQQSRDELSDEIRYIETVISDREKELKPSSAEIETVLRAALLERWPSFRLNPSVSDIYDVYVVHISE